MVHANLMYNYLRLFRVIGIIFRCWIITITNSLDPVTPLQHILCIYFHLGCGYKRVDRAQGNCVPASHWPEAQSLVPGKKTEPNMSKLVLDKQYPKAIKYHISYTISIALVKYTYINRNLCKRILQMFLRIKQSHIHICVYGKYVYFFPAQSNPFGIVYTSLQEILKRNPTRMHSRSYGLSIFCTINWSLVLARNRW